MRAYVPETRGLSLEQVQVLLAQSALTWDPDRDASGPDADSIDRLHESGAFDPPLAEVDAAAPLADACVEEVKADLFDAPLT